MIEIILILSAISTLLLVFIAFMVFIIGHRQDEDRNKH